MAQARSAGSAWASFIIVLITGIAYAVSLMAVPTAMVQMTTYYFGGEIANLAGELGAEAAAGAVINQHIGDTGLLMSWNSVAGTILAFFTASIQSKIGPKNMLIVGLACILVSDIILIFTPASPDGLTVGFVARFIFGFANGLIATAAPTLVTILFTDANRRGMPNGIWSMWIALGGIIISFAAPMLMGPALDWIPLFYFGIGVAVIALLLVIFALRIPHAEMMEAVAATGKVRISDAFKNGYVWLCFVMMICFAYAFSCYSGMAVTYFQVDVGMDPATAQGWFGILNFVGIIAGLLAGIIMNRVNDHTKVLVVVFILATIACAISFAFSVQTLAIITMFFFGLAVNAVVPIILTNVQWVSASPAVISAAFGICAIASNGGGIPANPSMGAIIASGAPWAMCGVPPTIVAAIGLICAFVFAAKRGKFAREGIAAARHAEDAIS